MAIAGAASLVLAFGENIDVQLRITTVGRTDWPDLVILLAGSVAVACYACRVGVPRPRLPSVIAVGALAVVVAQGLTPVSADLSREGRTLIAALLIGILGRMLAHRSAAPAALWMAPPLPRHAPTALDRSALPRPRHPQRNRRHHAGRSVDPG